jgi:hypothetical protein
VKTSRRVRAPRLRAGALQRGLHQHPRVDLGTGAILRRPFAVRGDEQELES